MARFFRWIATHGTACYLFMWVIKLRSNRAVQINIVTVTLLGNKNGAVCCQSAYSLQNTSQCFLTYILQLGKKKCYTLTYLEYICSYVTLYV